MKHSAMNRRLLLEWLCDCDDAGEPMPTDAQIRDRFRFTSEEQARGLLTDLAEAKLVVVTGVGRSRTVALPGAKPIRPTMLTRDDRDRLPATIKRADPGVERVTALISGLQRQAADKKERTMPKQPAAQAAPSPTVSAATGEVGAKLAAEITRISRAVVDGDTAQAEALSHVAAQLGEDLAAAVTRLDKAIVDGDSAQAQALASVRVALQEAVAAEVMRLDKAIVDGDHAQAEALGVVRADFGRDLGAAVTRLDQAIATGDNASAQALATVKAALEDAAAAESARLDRVIVDGDHAQAEAVAQVRARLGTTEATVTQHAAAIVDIEGKVMAYLDIEVEAGTNRAIVRLAADGRDGSTIDFAANALRFANPVDGKNITAMRVAGGNVEVVNDLLMGAGGHIIGRSGGYMTVTGAPFGSGRQFIEWYGPVKASLADCTAADAISYKTIDGDAYFGGSLTAGVLRNAVRTSALIGTANVTTGVFGSNGGARVVVVSLSFYGDASIDGPCPVAEQPYAKVQLWRGTNADGTMLVEQTFQGAHECMPGHGANEPGTMIDQLAGSFTFTDNSGGQTAAYFVRIVERSTNVTPIQQLLSLVSTEE